MMPITRQELEILLDTPERKDYVVSAYADMRVKDGFHRFVETHLKNQAREAGHALSETEARKVLDANITAIREAVETADASARGLAVFSGAQRGLKHAVNLDFPVENKLIIDEDPFVLPLLERWYGEPNYLVAIVDSHQVHLFEAHSGVAEEVMEIHREIDEDTQRDKPRFNYKKRFAQTRHERLHSLEEDGFLKAVAEVIQDHWKLGVFTGLMLLGQSQSTAAVRRLLPKDLEHAVVEEHAQTMTSKAQEVADDVDRVMARWRENRETQLLGELRQRWKENHMVANGPTEVLDALQQGRATQVVIGSRRDLSGARCNSCGYRFGAPTEKCVYCGGDCRTLNAVQEILRMALRHRIADVYLFNSNNGKNDPLADAGGVSALLRAEANWAPNGDTAKSSQGD